MKRILGFIYTDWKQGYDIGLMIIRVVLALVLFYGHGFEKISVILSGSKFILWIQLGLEQILHFIWPDLQKGFVLSF